MNPTPVPQPGAPTQAETALRLLSDPAFVLAWLAIVALVVAVAAAYAALW